MANLEGMEMKFTVIKNNDIEKHLTDFREYMLRKILSDISMGREYEGKKDNTYIVINTDEPYVEEVIEILKRHGHWG
jgi:hypothetical protein